MEESFIETIITEEDEGKTVVDVLRGRMHVSLNLLRSLKHRENGITLDGQVIRVRTYVHPGQILRIRSETEKSDEYMQPEEGELDIVYEDEALMVLQKPAGLPVHPTKGHPTGTLANRLAAYFQGKDFVFHAVNRLDKNTSGLLLIAKNRYWAAKLAEQLQHGDIRRTYLALVCGTDLPDQGRIDLPIARKDGYGIMREVRTDGMRAITNYTVIERYSRYLLVRVQLETGRTHQIRVHFSHLGHPVAGDFMYGTAIEGVVGQALHACQLELHHPKTGEELCFTAPVPDYFDEIIRNR